MTGIVITSGDDYVKVVFGNLAGHPLVQMERGYWSRRQFNIYIPDEGGVTIQDKQTGMTWRLSVEGTEGCLPVESINTVQPVSDINLCDLLGVLVK